MPVCFKASFDKANRSRLAGARGPGVDEGLRALERVRAASGLPLLTDIHEAAQAPAAAEVADVLQIPAFLCRQTDLLVAAGRTGRPVNVKKGQWMPPEGMAGSVEKVRSGGSRDVAVTERGTFFGYGDLVVDMRNFARLRQATGAPVIFDATHAVQRPGQGEAGSSGGRSGAHPAAARRGGRRRRRRVLSGDPSGSGQRRQRRGDPMAARPAAGAAGPHARSLGAGAWRLTRRWRGRVRIVALDVDGVLTDNGIWIGPVAGERVELKRFDIQDGLGHAPAPDGGHPGRLGQRPALGGERAARRRSCGWTSCSRFPGPEKLEAMAELLARRGLDWDGCGLRGRRPRGPPGDAPRRLPIAVANAVPEVRAVAARVTTASGGHGAVREFADALLKARGVWPEMLERYFTEPVRRDA